jgi:sugar phosphate isomerase/epimerase
MRFAFPAQLLADPADAVGRARELGYDALELSTDATDAAGLESLAERWRFVDWPVACLATALTMPNGSRERRRMAELLHQAIDAAGALRCRLVQIPGPAVPRGTTPAVAAVEMGRWLVPLADHASGQGVTIVVANANSFRTARPLWTLLETINHPNVAASWDLLSGFLAGQSPHVAVPTLNTRIQYARMTDAAVVDGKLQPRNLGEGEVPTRDFLDRLRGVGYTGCVTYAPPNPGDLPSAIAKLKEWTTPLVVKKPAAVPK